MSNFSNFETQSGNDQKMNQFQCFQHNIFLEQGQSDNSSSRVDFIKKMYICLTIEFFINLVIIALGFHTNLGTWLIVLNRYCFLGNCSYYITPSVLFYFSLIISIILSFTLYFGNCYRQCGIKQIAIILYQIFYGFTFTTICIFMVLSFQEGPVWIIWGNTFIIILSFTIYVCLKQREITWSIGAIIIVSTTIPLMIIFIFIDLYIVWEKVVGAVIVTTYGFYLILDTKLMLSKGRLNLQKDDYWVGSLLLYGLMIQPSVRTVEFLIDTMRNRNR